MKISNWSGSVQFHPKKVVLPSNTTEVQEIVRDACAEGKNIRLIGSGHSFSRLIETQDVLMSLDKLTGIIGDQLLAGTKLWRMNEILFKLGRAMENLGDINRQSIAGALSTGTHGTGLQLGTVSTQLQSIELVTGTGDIVSCTHESDPDLFKAAQVSIGALGVITRVTLKTLPAYQLKLELSRAKLADCLERCIELGQKNRHFEFFSFPYSDAVQLKVANLTTDAHPPSAISTFISEVLMENISFKLLSMISKAFPALAPKISKLCGAFVSDRVKADWAHQIFSTPRWVKFQEMEYSVPAASMKDVVTEIREMIVKKNVAVHFPIECRFVKGDDVWLSPAYGRDSAYIAIHMYKGMEYEPYFKSAESIFLNHGGRPHWGKMNFLEPSRFRQIYPKWNDFNTIRMKLDPKGVFLNSTLRKMFVSE